VVRIVGLTQMRGAVEVCFERGRRPRGLIVMATCWAAMRCRAGRRVGSGWLVGGGGDIVGWGRRRSMECMFGEKCGARGGGVRAGRRGSGLVNGGGSDPRPLSKCRVRSREVESPGEGACSL